VDLDESRVHAARSQDLAGELAKAKAAAAEVNGRHEFVLAADTVVIDDGSILGKPEDEKEALQMLRRLRGRSHQVVTAIAVRHIASGRTLLEACLTDVPMRMYSEGELERYVQSGSPLDKAGAYGIQDASFAPVDAAAFSGCYANVMGLPLCHLTRALRAFGWEPLQAVPAACARETGYDCPVYSSILRGDV